MYLFLATGVDAAPELTLTSEPPALMENTIICQGPVVLTCDTTGIPLVFQWVLNNTPITEYSFDFRDMYPQNLSIIPFEGIPSLVDSKFQVTNATMVSTGLMDLTSTWIVPDISILNGLSVRCGSIQIKSNAVIPNVAYQQGELHIISTKLLLSCMQSLHLPPIFIVRSCQPMKI